jgi:hypothetical protein
MHNPKVKRSFARQSAKDTMKRINTDVRGCFLMTEAQMSVATDFPLKPHTNSFTGKFRRRGKALS